METTKRFEMIRVYKDQIKYYNDEETDEYKDVYMEPEYIEDWPSFINCVKRANQTKKLSLHRVYDLTALIGSWSNLIGSLKSLVHLDINGYYEGWDDSCTSELMRGLLKNNSITSLKIEVVDLDLNSEHLEQLAEVIESKCLLKTLYIWRLTVQDTRGAEAFRRILRANQLKKLVINILSIDQVRNQFWQAFEHDRTLERVNIFAGSDGTYGTAGVALSKWLAHSTSIRKLDVPQSIFKHEDLILFIKALEHNRSLNQLHLAKLNDECCEVLCATLQRNGGLESLSFTISESSRLRNIRQICNALKVNKALTDLYVSSDKPHKNSYWPAREKSCCQTFLTTLSKLLKPHKVKPELPLIHEMLDVNKSLIEFHFCSISSWRYTRINEKLSMNYERYVQNFAGLLIIIHNIARQHSALLIFPSEIWLLIFSHVKILKRRVGPMAESIFKRYNRN